jgi:hypothetical protein
MHWKWYRSKRTSITLRYHPMCLKRVRKIMTTLIHNVIDYDEARLCLRTAATNRPIIYAPGDMRTWRARVMIMPAGNNSWLVHRSSLAVLPADTSKASRRNGRRSKNFAYQYLKYLKRSLTCRKILRHGISGFTSHPTEGVLRIFIALKNPSLRSDMNPWPFVSMTSTLTTTPPRRPSFTIVDYFRTYWSWEPPNVVTFIDYLLL